jgi:hypothetical protein
LPEVISQDFQGMVILNDQSGKDCYADVYVDADEVMETAVYSS